MTTIHWFDPSCEEQVALGRAGHVPGRLPGQLARDLETLLLFLAEADDVVLLRDRPRPAYLESLGSAGFALPRCVTVAAGGLDARGIAAVAAALAQAARARAGDRPPLPARVRPWGWSPQTVAFLKPLAALQPDGLLAQWTAARARLYSKAFGVELLASFLRGHSSPLLCPGDTVGEVCADEAAVTAAAARAAAATASTGVVIKALYGQAGRGQLRLHGPRLGSAQAAWLRRTLATQGGVVVEARLDRAADMSLQLEIGAAEQTAPLGVTRFLTDPQGRFRGVLLPATPSPDHGPVPAGGQLPPGLLDQVAVHVGDALRAHGYRGPAGVDMLLYRTPSGCRLRPIVEVNPRCTMGRLALHLARHLAPGVAGVWRLLANPEAAAAGYADAARLAATAAARWPLALSANAIREGVLLTNDPQRAGHFLSLLAVGREPVRWLAATLKDPDLQPA